MSPPKGWKHKTHTVKCGMCPATREMATHWRQNPLCAKCRRKRWNKGNCAWYQKMRQQARRYRILVHHLGWPDTDEGFKDMLAEIRQSPMAFRKEPESRAGKLDLTWEKKLRRRAA